MWEFWKNRGGGLPESHFHFLLFLTWETPPKMQKKHDFFPQTNVSFPNRGEGGGVPHLGKIPTFSRFFIWGASLSIPYPNPLPKLARCNSKRWKPPRSPPASVSSLSLEPGFHSISTFSTFWMIFTKPCHSCTSRDTGDVHFTVFQSLCAHKQEF